MSFAPRSGPMRTDALSNASPLLKCSSFSSSMLTTFESMTLIRLSSAISRSGARCDWERPVRSACAAPRWRHCPTEVYFPARDADASRGACTFFRRRLGMKLYYHPVSTTSRPVVLFATESRHRSRLPARRPFHRRAIQAGILGDQSEPSGAGARGRRLPPDGELGDPQVPRRQGALARVPDGPAEARARQRADGLAQHRLLPRLLLRLPLSADLSVHAPDRRRRAGRARSRGARRRRWAGSRCSTRT